MFIVRNLMSNHVVLGYYNFIKFQNIVENVAGKFSCKTLAPFQGEDEGYRIKHCNMLIKVERQ